MAKINSRGEFHEAPGLTAFGLFPILIIMNPSTGFRRAGGAPPGLAQSLALLCFSLPCRAPRFAPPGLATLRVPFPFPLAAGALAKQMAASCGKESRGLGRPLFCLVATPLKASFHTAWLLNKISIAFAMLTPCEFMCFAEREGFEPPEPLSSTVFKTAAIDHSAISPIFCRDLQSCLQMTLNRECKSRENFQTMQKKR